jgi:hypothetical protein
MKKISLLIIISILISPLVYINIDGALADSNTYYVANNGNDSNNGLSPDSPWKTIGKVNSELNGGVINSGDDIYFKRGDIFSGELNIRVGGSSSNYMIIGAYGIGDKAIIENSGGSGDDNCIKLWTANVDYVTIQDFQLKNTVGSGDAISVCYNHTDISINNIYAENINGDELLYIEKTVNYSVENCVGNKAGFSFYGDLYNRLSNGYIANCTSYDVGHNSDAFSIHKEDVHDYDTGSNHLFYNCTAYNAAENCFDITAGNNVIFDSCKAWNGLQGSVSIGNNMHNLTFQNCIITNTNSSGIFVGDSNNVIIRNNIIWNITDIDALSLDSTDYIQNCTIYNNDFIYPSTFSGAYTNRVMSISYDFFSNTVLKNNIFASFNPTPQPNRLYRVYGAVIPPDNDLTFDTNIWWNANGNAATKWWDNGSTTMNIVNWQYFYPTDDFDDPEFADAGTGDLSLNITSPCIDAGTWLTQTNGGGSGTTITVDDSSYFMDGYGMMKGDKIFVGDDINLLITNVNYMSNQITVNRSITWSNGENVSLSLYSGYKPDIGAIEFIQNEQYPFVTNISLTTSNPIDTDPSFGWINTTCEIIGDMEVQQVKLNITKPDGRLSSVTMNTYGANIYYYNSSNLFSIYGNYSYNIWACDTNQNSKTSDLYNFYMPPNWDINKDGHITVLDLALISNRYGESGPNGWICEDINNDGNINIIDMVTVSNHYGENCFT